MIWILYIAGGFVALLLLMAAIGAVLPRDHLAARQATFAKPPDAVWSAMNDVMRDFETKMGIKSVVDVDERPRRKVTRIADDKLPFGGRWIYELEPVADGTRLRITEDGFVKNPIFRFISALTPNATKTRFLRSLARQLGVETAVEPAEPSAPQR